MKWIVTRIVEQRFEVEAETEEEAKEEAEILGGTAVINRQIIVEPADPQKAFNFREEKAHRGFYGT